MREKKPKQRRLVWRDLKSEIKENKATFIVYIVLRVLVIAAMVLSLFRRDYENLFVCTLSLALFLVPAFLEKNLGISLPSVLEIIILLFIFAAEILGEMNSFYIKYAFWDTMLHTINGFLFAAVGFALVDILNRNERVKFTLSPLFVAIAAFCFSMTIGVFWEFFEWGVDILLHTDMQKDTVIHSITTVLLDSSNSNIPITVSDIPDVVVNGQSLGLGGYLDIGLHDTMKDMFVNFIGAFVFSIIGFFYVKNRGKGKFAALFIPRLKKEKETEK